MQGRRATPTKARGMQAMLYKYDQLHRITRSRSLTSYSAANGFAPKTNSAYDETYTYDGNGNILTLDRMNAQGQVLHDYDYYYYRNSNKLRGVLPIVRDTTYNATINSNNKLYRDILVEGTARPQIGTPAELRAARDITIETNFEAEEDNNFAAYISEDGLFIYDAIGNLTADQEEGSKISWTPDGKVREVKTNNDSIRVKFRYDATGNRIEKRVEKWDTVMVTRYLRDASGNVMSIYKDTTVLEVPTYGSARLGMYRGEVPEGMQILGRRSYELSNHLGNVLTVITDNIGMERDSIWCTVTSTSDYYPFGLEMQARSWRDTTSLAPRYGFNGKEKDAQDEWGSTIYDYGFRIYKPAIAKFLSVDPLTKSYPELTPYQFASNSPISGIDLDGLEFVLKIYSPILSEKFNRAVNDKDIYEQRRVTNYALSTEFANNWVERATGDVGSPPGNKAATLTRDDNVSGVRVVTYGYYNNDINTGKIIPIKSEVWEPSANGAPDAYYPVDVKEKSFYDSHGDFVATYNSGSAIQGYGSSAALIQGYLRGWGYVEYAATGTGYGDDAGASVGSMFGNFKGEGDITPETLAGKGWQSGLSIRMWGYGKWEGYANDVNEVAWTGSYYSMSMGISFRSLLESKVKWLKRVKDIGGSQQKTNTSLLFPTPKAK